MKVAQFLSLIKSSNFFIVRQGEFTQSHLCGILSPRSMKKIIQFGVIILFLVLGFLAYQYLLPQIRPSRGFIKVDITPSAEVLLDGESLGNSPLQEKGLPIGRYELVIKTDVPTMPNDPNDDPGSKSVALKQDIELEASAVTTIKYELAPNEQYYSGEVLGLRKGAGLSIITKPENSEVFVDGESLGSAPLSQIVDPGVHTLKISKEGYISREIGVNIEKGFRLTTSVTLALNPYPQTKKLSEKGKFTIYDLSSENSELNTDYGIWSEAIWHFQNIGTDVPKKFDVLVDNTGKTYTLVADYSKKKKVSVGYLSGSPGKLSDKAKSAWGDLTNGKSKSESSLKILVLDTPNGFLNVRSGPSTNNSILAKINQGESFNLVGEEKDWYKIIYESSKEGLSSVKSGWISSQYAKKQ